MAVSTVVVHADLSMLVLFQLIPVNLAAYHLIKMEQDVQRQAIKEL